MQSRGVYVDGDKIRSLREARGWTQKELATQPSDREFDTGGGNDSDNEQGAIGEKKLTERTIRAMENSSDRRFDILSADLVAKQLGVPSVTLQRVRERSIVIDLTTLSGSHPDAQVSSIKEKLIQELGEFITLGVRFGSLILRIAVTEDQAEKLFELYDSGKLDDVGVQTLREVPVTELAVVKRRIHTRDLLWTATIVFIVAVALIPWRQYDADEWYVVSSVVFGLIVFDFGRWMEQQSWFQPMTLTGLAKLIIAITVVTHCLVPLTKEFGYHQLRSILLVSLCLSVLEVARRALKPDAPAQFSIVSRKISRLERHYQSIAALRENTKWRMYGCALTATSLLYCTLSTTASRVLHDLLSIPTRLAEMSDVEPNDVNAHESPRLHVPLDNKTP